MSDQTKDQQKRPRSSYTTKGASKGAILITEHSNRRMKSYLVLEGELIHISMLNGWMTLFISTCSGFFSLALGLWSGLFVEGSPSEIAKEYGRTLEVTFVGLSILFGFLAIWAYCNRKSEVDRIKRESDETAV
jgi:hypothetical protein